MVLDVLGRSCAICGFSDVRALQIDHINGGGRRHRLLLGSGNDPRFYKDVLENKYKFQILCANCNQIKRVENKEN